MTLKELIKTNIYECADIVSFVNRNGEEIEGIGLLSSEVISTHSRCGCLEIELNVE